MRHLQSLTGLLLPAAVQSLRVGLTLGLLCWGWPAMAAAQEAYQPLFSESVLKQADPESRARLEALNERNRQRWLDQQAGNRGAEAPAAEAGSQPQARQRSARPAASGNKLYRITGPDGSVRFSDQYVAGAKEVSVATRNPSAQSRAEHEARLAEQAKTLEYFDERNRRRQKEADESRRAAAQAKDREQRCHDLFLEIQDNRRGGFVSYDVGPDGERVYLSDAELAAQTDKMEADYREHCGELPAITR